MTGDKLVERNPYGDRPKCDTCKLPIPETYIWFHMRWGWVCVCALKEPRAFVPKEKP